MKTDQLMSSLCYFSIFFAPFLFPIVVYFLADGEVKYHAKRALLSHLLPFASIIFLFFITITIHHIVFWIGIVIFLFIVMMIVITIWNLVMGIKLLLR